MGHAVTNNVMWRGGGIYGGSGIGGIQGLPARVSRMAVIRNCDRRRRAVSVPRLAQAAAIASQTGLPGPRALVQESPQGSAGESLGLVGPLMALLAGPHCQSLAIRGLTVPGPMVVLMA